MPTSLAVLSVISIVGGAVMALVFGIGYLNYEAPETDEGVVMDMGATGPIVCLFFLSFVVIGIAILAGKTWGVSASIITNVILVPVAFSLFRSGQAGLGSAVAILVVVCLVLAFRGDSRQWLDAHYAERSERKNKGKR